MGFGSYFRDLRIEKQITQKQIADVIKKKPMLVSNVENGKNGPFSDNDLKKIVSFLELSKDEERQLYKEAAKARGKLPRWNRYVWCLPYHCRRQNTSKRITCSKHLQETSLEASLCLK